MLCGSVPEWNKHLTVWLAWIGKSPKPASVAPYDSAVDVQPPLLECVIPLWQVDGNDNWFSEIQFRSLVEVAPGFIAIDFHTVTLLGSVG